MNNYDRYTSKRNGKISSNQVYYPRINNNKMKGIIGYVPRGLKDGHNLFQNINEDRISKPYSIKKSPITVQPTNTNPLTSLKLPKLISLQTDRIKFNKYKTNKSKYHSKNTDINEQNKMSHKNIIDNPIIVNNPKIVNNCHTDQRLRSVIEKKNSLKTINEDSPETIKSSLYKRKELYSKKYSPYNEPLTLLTFNEDENRKSLQFLSKSEHIKMNQLVDRNIFNNRKVLEFKSKINHLEKHILCTYPVVTRIFKFLIPSETWNSKIIFHPDFINYISLCHDWYQCLNSFIVDLQIQMKKDNQILVKTSYTDLHLNHKPNFEK